MATFLQIVGIVFLGLIALLGAAVVTVLLIYRRASKAPGGAYPEWLGSGTALRVTLNPIDDTEWQVAEPYVEESRNGLLARGFEACGHFRVKEMQHVVLTGLVHPTESVLAAVYHNESLGCWVDVCSFGVDGREFTVSNSPVGGQLDTRPEARKIFRAGSSAPELFEQLLAVRGPGPFLPVHTESFVQEFQNACARDLKWRAERGTTEQELRRVADHSGERYSEKQIRAAHQEIRSDQIDQMTEDCLRILLEQSSWSASEWEEIRNRVVLLHEHMNLDHLVYCCQAVDKEAEGLIESVKSDSRGVLVAFEDFLTQIPEKKRWKKLAEMHEPIEASLYIMKDEPICSCGFC